MPFCVRLRGQKDRDFEVLVADDGSGAGDGGAGRAMASRGSASRSSHVWHEHRGFRAGEIRNRAILRIARRLCRVPRRRLPGAARFRRDPSQARRARLVRHRQPGAADAGTDRRGAERPARTRALGHCRLAGGSVSTAGSIASRRCYVCRSARCERCGRRPGRARGPAISRSGAPTSTASMASTRLQRLGQGGFRSAGAAAARRRAAQGRRFRDRRAASVASRTRTARNWRRMNGCSPMCSQAGACAPVRGCRRSRWVPPRSIADD